MSSFNEINWVKLGMKRHVMEVEEEEPEEFEEAIEEVWLACA